jgi:hypothetical protein
MRVHRALLAGARRRGCGLGTRGTTCEENSSQSEKGQRDKIHLHCATETHPKDEVDGFRFVSSSGAPYNFCGSGGLEKPAEV